VVNHPRLVIGGTRSGDGKTTVATGLMAALAVRGLRVSAHKVGPDYIDPSYHAAATGAPGRNLDPWLTGEDLIAPLFLHGASAGTSAGGGGTADVSVIEGVMGLFDGVTGRGDLASTAHVARLLRAPIVLVVTATGAARSIAATVHGFATFDPATRIAGVVLNQVGSARHETILREAIAPLGIPVLGALPAEATLHTPSRHLGLVPAAERAGQVSNWLPRLRELITRHLDLDHLLAIARAAPALAAPPWSPADAVGQVARGPAPWTRGPDTWNGSAPPGSAPPASAVPGSAPLGSAVPGSVPLGSAVPGSVPLGSAVPPSARNAAARNAAAWSAAASGRDGAPVRIAVAGGQAFTFGYTEHRELLEAAGAEVAEFDPMTAERLPAGTDALVIGGGFPQVYVDALAANATLRAEVRARVAGGMPVVAECAGLLWLGASLDGREQCGVLPATARMTGRLTLGYREAVALTDSPLAAAGTAIRAHEFHRTVSEPAAGPAPAWQLTDGSRQGWASPRLLASYLHLHWAGLPAAAPRLVAAARAAQGAQRRAPGPAPARAPVPASAPASAPAPAPAPAPSASREPQEPRAREARA
jgi:cobyrinic acid a,c-diamide synthase